MTNTLDITIDDLVKQLSEISHPSMFADIIREKPLQSIPMIRDQIKDNRPAICEIIGEPLVEVIEQL